MSVVDVSHITFTDEVIKTLNVNIGLFHIIVSKTIKLISVNGPR